MHPSFFSRPEEAGGCHLSYANQSLRATIIPDAADSAPAYLFQLLLFYRGRALSLPQLCLDIVRGWIFYGSEMAMFWHDFVLALQQC